MAATIRPWMGKTSKRSEAGRPSHRRGELRAEQGSGETAETVEGSTTYGFLLGLGGPRRAAVSCRILLK